MENIEFFYIVDEQQLGPVTLLELQNLNLSRNTLIWYEDLADWTELKNIEQLSNLVRFQKTPPPIPNKQKRKFETEVSGELRLKKDIEVNENIEKLKPSRKTFRRFVIWTGIHLFILLMSYSQISFFNSGKPRTDEFWPFVAITGSYMYIRLFKISKFFLKF